MGEELISDAISKIVNAGDLAGAATLVWRNGKAVSSPSLILAMTPRMLLVST